MSRTVTFTCPNCGRQQSSTVYWREDSCVSCHCPVYFAEDWSASLDPNDRYSDAPDWLATTLALLVVAAAVGAFVAWLAKTGGHL